MPPTTSGTLLWSAKLIIVEAPSPALIQADPESKITFKSQRRSWIKDGSCGEWVFLHLLLILEGQPLLREGDVAT